MNARPCRHCGTPVGGPSAYCCSGCEGAAALLAGLGLEDWYDRREGPGPRASLPEVDLRGIAVEREGDEAIARLRLDGLRCASCVELVEAVLERRPEVREVHVSFATGHARVAFDPGRELSEVLEPVQRLGYRPVPLGTRREADRGLLLRLGFACFAAANVMLMSAALYVGWVEPLDPASEALFRWLILALSAPVALWAAQPFHAGAWAGLRARRLHMDLPISLAVLGMFAHGLLTTVQGGETWLDSLVMLVALLLIGRVLEQRGRRAVAEAAMALAAEAPGRARVLRGERIEEVDADELELGEVLELAAGERLAADGVVCGGSGAVDLALVTGESAPVRTAPGLRLPAGAVLQSGSLRLRITRLGADTLLAASSAALAKALDEPLRDASPRTATLFTAGTLLASALAWWLWGDLEPAVAVLVAACPCAFVLARPLCLGAGLGAAARRGLLLRDGQVLERLAEVHTIWLDKTGTLTHGEPRVLAADDEVLRLATGLERSSLHPVARALVGEAIGRGLPLAEAERVLEEPGRGVHGLVEGHALRIEGLEDGDVGVFVDGRRHRIRLADRCRASSREAVEGLRRRGLRVGLLSGDAEEPSRRVADALGIVDVIHGARPLEKLDRVATGGVCFVGDGLNDAPALAAAEVGLAMSSGAAPSVLSADGVLVEAGVRPLLAGVDAARAATGALRRARRRAVVYNLLAVGAALSGLLDPLVAALAMPLSSALVLASAASVERRMGE